MPLEKVYIGSQQIWPSGGGGGGGDFTQEDADALYLPIDTSPADIGAATAPDLDNTFGIAMDHNLRHQDGGADELALDASQIVSGTMPVARGGTGQTALAGDRVVTVAADGLSLTTPAAGANGNVLTSQGGGAPPLFTNLLMANLGCNVAAPSAASDLTRKDYVDSQVSTAVARYIAVNAQTGTSYTLVLTDAGKLVTLDNAGAVTLTVPLNSTVAFAVGAIIDLAGLGVGLVTVAATGGVTINATPSLGLRARYSSASLIKLATNTWLLVGDLA